MNRDDSEASTSTATSTYTSGSRLTRFSHDSNDTCVCTSEDSGSDPATRGTTPAESAAGPETPWRRVGSAQSPEAIEAAAHAEASEHASQAFAGAAALEARAVSEAIDEAAADMAGGGEQALCLWEGDDKGSSSSDRV